MARLLKTRRKLPKATRKMVLECFYYSCALCMNPFTFPEIHHIQFVSLGGCNDPDNLLPLCASCHSTLHNLSQVFSESTVREIRRRAIESTKIKTLVLRRDLPKEELVRALTNADIRFMVSTSGWYTHFATLFEEALDYINGQTNLTGKYGRDVNKALLLSLIGEIFLYSNIEGNIPKGMYLLNKAYNQLRRSSDFLDTTCYIGTVMSKGYELARQRIKEKQILMDVGNLDMSDLDTRNLWLWRSMSHYVNVGKLDEAMELRKYFQFGSETNFGKQVESNALSIMAHMDIGYGHNIEDAIEKQKIGLKNAVDIFHKRGIYFRSFNLASLYLRKKDYAKAIGYLRLAGLLKDCGFIIKEWDAQRLYFKISNTIGTKEYSQLLHIEKIPNIGSISDA